MPNVNIFREAYPNFLQYPLKCSNQPISPEKKRKTYSSVPFLRLSIDPY